MAASNAQKTPLTRALHDHTRGRVKNGIQLIGKALACSVTHIVSSKIVTVKWEINDPDWPVTLPPVTMAVMGTEYVREPIQVGCKGMAVPADVFMGAMTGLGSGVATFNTQPNLSTHVFMPTGNTGFAAVDFNTLWLYGASSGTLISDSAANHVTVAITSTGITINLNGHTMLIENGDLHVTGSIIGGFGGGDQIGLLTHTHTQPADSHGDTEAAVNPPTAGT